MDKAEAYKRKKRNRLVDRMRSAKDPVEKARLAVIIYTKYFKNANMDADEPDWITVNGTHIPLDDEGNAEGGGGLKGENFSEAKSEESAKPKGSSSKAAQDAFSKKMKEEKEELLKGDDTDKAYAMYESGFLTYDEAVEAMDNGTADDFVKQYYDIMEQNGNTESEKPLADNGGDMNKDVDSGKYPSYEEAKIGFIEEKTGLPKEECKEISKQIDTWVSNQWDEADTSQVDKFIENDSTYEGEIYRGLHFGTGDTKYDYDDFMKNIQPGSVISLGDSGHNASWSSGIEDAVNFSHRGQDDLDTAIIKCVKNRTSSPIAYLNNHGEQEVVSHSKAQWTVLNVQEYEKSGGGRHAEITVVECGDYRSDTNGDSRMDKNEKKKEKKGKGTMFDRWEESSKDFKAEKPKKKY